MVGPHSRIKLKVSGATVRRIFFESGDILLALSEDKIFS